MFFKVIYKYRPCVRKVTVPLQGKRNPEKSRYEYFLHRRDSGRRAQFAF